MRSWTAKAPTTSDPGVTSVALRGARRRRARRCGLPGGPHGRQRWISANSSTCGRDNSWTQKIDQISTPELAEVFAINALAPFVINSKLIPVLKDGASNERRRFVVNVSAMEGKFYRHKQPTHPHTPTPCPIYIFGLASTATAGHHTGTWPRPRST